MYDDRKLFAGCPASHDFQLLQLVLFAGQKLALYDIVRSKLTLLIAYPDGSRFNLDYRVLPFNPRHHFTPHTPCGTPKCEDHEEMAGRAGSLASAQGCFD